MPRSGKGWAPFATQVEGVTKYTEGGEAKVGFCDHTAGGFYTVLSDPGFWNRQGYSVHFGISRKGEVCQIVNIFDTAWAQGLDSRNMPVGPDSPGVTWPPFATMGKRSPNNYLISTEHEDYVSVNGVSHAVPDSQWTPEEFAADLKVKRWCLSELERYGVNVLRFGIDSLASHHMFDPVNRSYCAGKFWREQYRTGLFNELGTPPASTLETGMANLNGDGSQRIVSDGNFITTYNNNIAVQRVGSTDGKFPGRMSKNFGGNWLWFRTLNDAGQLVAPYWSDKEGD